MADKLIGVGNKIEINIIKDRNVRKDEEKVTYVSQVLDWEGEQIVAALPIHEGHLVTLEVNSNLECYFYTGSGIYKANAHITSRYKQGNLYVMNQELKDEPKKFQRRQFYRLPCNIITTLRTLSVSEVLDYSMKHEVKDNPEAQVVQGVIVDISGGGTRVFSKSKYKSGDYVYMNFPLEMNIGIKNVSVLAKVISSSELAGKQDFCDNRLQFKEIPASLRDSIVKYIFEQQRKKQNSRKEG